MFKLYQAFQYLRYLMKSKTEHGVHSPFVYSLLMEAVYNKKEFYAYKQIEEIRAKLLDSNETLTCIDLGAGSQKGNSTRKKLRQIAQFSAKSPKHAQLLFRLVNYFQPGTILELGTSLGISTAYMGMANSKSKIVTIEGCEEIAAIASKNFKELQIENIQQVTGNFDEVIPSVLKEIGKIDFVFFDGNHRQAATLTYFNQCLANADNASVFVFDDIYWSPEMKQAWEEIKNHPRVSVTMDLFYLGVVFFRTEQVKEHFVIKF